MRFVTHYGIARPNVDVTSAAKTGCVSVARSDKTAIYWGMNKAVVRLVEGMGWHVVILVNRSASKM